MSKAIKEIEKPMTELEEQNVALCSKIQNGTDSERSKAEQDLIILNNKYVSKIMHLFIGYCNGTILEPEDLWNSAAIGLLRAAKTFDPGKASFSTYAYFWMRQSVMRSISCEAHAIRVPVHALDLYCRARKKYKNEPDDNFEKMIINDEHYTEAQKNTILNVFRVWALKSLDEPVSVMDDESAPIGDFIASDRDVEGEVMNDYLYDRLVELMDECLKEREKWVIERRYGLNGNVWTLEKCGRYYPGGKVTRERIRQVEKRALEKMQKRAKREGLDLFLQRT